MVSFNVEYFLQLCLLSIKEAIRGLEAEIIVVDNNSQDGTVTMIRRLFPEVVLLINTENVGFAQANNQGVAVSKGEQICFVNPDIMVPGDIFKKLSELEERLPDVGGIGPRLIDGRGLFLQESKRNIPAPLIAFQRLFGIRSGIIKKYYASHISEKSLGAVEVLTGAFLWIKKTVFQEIGGFDTAYFIYGEDIDLAYRLKKAGYQNYYCGKVTAVHFKGESTKLTSFYKKQFYTAMTIFYKKHFKTNWLLDRIVWVGVSFVSSVQFLFDKKKDLPKNKELMLVSQNQKLVIKIEKAVKKEVALATLNQLPDLGTNNIEVIFDGDFVRYDEMISAMQSNNTHTITFRIRPRNECFFLGSDCSSNHGEVVLLG
ncbi:glycosyltransferase family 2 protein [Aquimarina sp. TRL1]|uniref:glycosyltransferase family 2 protein n=1 Tax=Aquimarina sp. (strain TRL1) TaxID=2736252 RepID=UPI0026E0C1A6|nr:glycosyltransferase family 2 protein [Aquimarina sp. TRL1]